MDFNTRKPTEQMLNGWANLTNGNHHKTVRAEIGDWAARYCRDKRVAKLIRECRQDIVAIYEKAEKSGEYPNGEFETMCQLTRIMMDMIANEYGQETARLIGTTM